MGDKFVFDQYKEQLEKSMEKLNDIIEKADELKATLVEMRNGIENTLAPKKDEEIEVERNPIKDEDENLVMEDEVTPVAEPAPVAPEVQDTPEVPETPVVEQPAPVQPVEEKPSGLTNFKAALNDYPAEIDIVNPAQVTVEEKPKKTIFKTPEFQPLNNIEIDIVNPNAAPVQEAPVAPQPVTPVAQNDVQFNQAPVPPVVPEITQTPGFTDSGIQTPQTTM